MMPIANGGRVALREVPRLPVERFRQEIVAAVGRGGRLCAFFGRPAGDGTLLLALLSSGETSGLAAVSARVGDAYPALTPDCPQAHWFEREIHESCGVTPLGHPWLKPVRFPRGDVGTADFYRVEGPEIHEVAVGPVHAGIIEPGHFRFQCHGERVLHLEISLGYQHRGVERGLAGGPDRRTMPYLETLAGDTSIGHAYAGALVIEALAAVPAPPRADALRGIALELERLANHTGDLGALAGDIGFLPTASFCGRLRGDFLNLTAALCGNRFGRGLVRPGGVLFDLDPARADGMKTRLADTLRDVTAATDLLWETATVLSRFEDTGIVTSAACAELGLVGPPARACGLERDVRYEQPCGIYRFRQIPVSTWSTGDVLARANVRALEIQRSAEFVDALIGALPEGPLRIPTGALAPDSLAVSLIEGWRGEICHAAVTDDRGRFATYRIVDPSCHNWTALALAMRGQEISDFPLCNKSFNLSYCGHDL